MKKLFALAFLFFAVTSSYAQYGAPGNGSPGGFGGSAASSGGGGGGTVTSVTASAPLSSSGGNTPNITLSTAFAGPNFSVGVSTLNVANGVIMVDTGTAYAGSTALTVSNNGSGTYNLVLTAPGSSGTAVEKLVRGSGNGGASDIQFSDFAGANVWQVGMAGGVNLLSLNYNGTPYINFLTSKPSIQIGATQSPFNGDPFDVFVSAASGTMGAWQNTHAGTSIIYFDVPDGSQAEYRFTVSGGTAKWGMANSGSDNWILVNDNTGHTDITALSATDEVDTFGTTGLGTTSGTGTQIYRCSGGTDAGWVLYGNSGAAQTLCTGGGGSLVATGVWLP